LYVGVGKGGIFFGYDGINWTASASGNSLVSSGVLDLIGKIGCNGSIWVIVCNGSPNTIIYSSDGINWNGVANSSTIFNTNGGAFDLAWNGTVWVATGANSTSGSLIAISYDGIVWTNLNSSNVPYLTA
jgi:hypothetical protein